MVFSILSESFRQANINLEQYLPSDDDYSFADIPSRLRQTPTDIAGNVVLNNYYPFGDPPKTVYWFLLTVEFTSNYEISVISRDSDDLVAGLYRARELSLVYSNDDFAGKSDPVLTGPLDPGEYFLRISEYFGADVGPAEINFKDLNATRLLNPNQLATEAQTIGPAELDRTIAIIGEPQLERWVAMRVDSAGVYTVTVQNGDPNVDLMAELYNVGNGRLVAADDDSAGLFNPKMTASLAPGDYFIKVSEWTEFLDVGDFSVTLARVPVPAQAF